MNYCFRIFKNIFLSLFIFLSFVFYGGCENGAIGNGLLTLNCNSILLTAIELIVVFYEQMLVELHSFYIQPVSYKRYFWCNNCVLLLVYAINLSLNTDLVDPYGENTFSVKPPLQ